MKHIFVTTFSIQSLRVFAVSIWTNELRVCLFNFDVIISTRKLPPVHTKSAKVKNINIMWGIV